MKLSLAVSVGIALSVVSAAAVAGPREDVARAWAPVIFQEANDPVKDSFAAFDFDGNWDGDDNSENMQCWFDSAKCNTADNPSSPCAGQKCPLIATVYFTVIETSTHWFVQYMPYHPLDWKVTNGHEHDTESMFLVVRKDGTPLGKPQAMEVQYHGTWYQYSADPNVKDGADNVDGQIKFDAQSGRPLVDVEMVGHGFCGGHSPRNDVFPDLQIVCTHSDTPHIEKWGIVYRPDLPAQMPAAVANQTVSAGYALVEAYDSVWTHIHEIGKNKAFGGAVDFNGERCNLFTCPKQFGGAWEGNEGSSPSEPWNQSGGVGVNASGDQFFDPAYTMSKRLNFPQPFSLDYCHNPYVGITNGCGADADGGARLDAGAGVDSGVSTVPVDAATAGTGYADASSDPGAAPAPAGSSGCACDLSAASANTWGPLSGVLVALAALRRRVTTSRLSCSRGRRRASPTDSP